MRIPILRFATIVTCLVLCSAPYQVQATQFAFVSDGNTFTTIDVPGGFLPQATGINNAGQIVGSYYDPPGTRHGCLYSGGSLTSINAPGATSTSAWGINDAGQIVGRYGDSPPPAAAPESSSLLLLGFGLLGLAAWRWKQAA